MALPAVVLVLAACVGALQISSAQVRLQDAAGFAARAAARGGPSAPATAPGATIRIWREGELVCASAERAASWAPGLAPISLTARSCALAGG